MAVGWEQVRLVKRVEAKAEELGFVLQSTPHNTGAWVSEGRNNEIYVNPKDDSLPHYARDTYFFSGSLESIDIWLQGIDWARRYDELLKLSNSEKRTAKEQVERNKQLMKTIKAGELVTGKLGGYGTQEDDEYDDTAVSLSYLYDKHVI